MVQEIDIKLNVIFLQKQIRDTTLELDDELIEYLQKETDGQPIKVTGMLSAMGNAHIRLTTGVDASKDEREIGLEIRQRVRDLLPMGTLKIEVLALREEAEIYNNK